MKMCNCTVIESFGTLIIKAERWSSVNGDSLNILTVARSKDCSATYWPTA